MLDRLLPSTEQASATTAFPSESAPPREAHALPRSPTQESEARSKDLEGTTGQAQDEPSGAGIPDGQITEPVGHPLQDLDQEPLDPSIADSIDWDAVDDTSWDAILRETDKGWEGISLEEARRQGLIDDIEGP